ncbi:MAG: FAD-dependent oxidoreductase [Oscillospiraceae bacterium]|nr:FAD-dependent oxidoreductase [Oscillospiraceae bacterium]
MKKITTDIAVLGAGPSGLSCALRASEFGLKVAVFEKTSTWGGVNNGGMGPFGAGTHIQKKYGMTEGTAENALNYLFDFTHGQIDARLASEYIRKTAFTIKWLEDYGVIYADPSASPFTKPGEKEYYCHVIAENPEFKEPDGRNMWMYIPTLLHKRAVNTGLVDFYFNTAGVRLLCRDGIVTGVVVQNDAGEQTEVHAGAVVIATGGFMGNPELIKKYTSYENNVNIFFSCQRPNICGDGMQMAWDIGAARSEMMVDAYKGMPIHCGPVGTKEGWEILASRNLMVNLKGERFMNEAWHDRFFVANAIHRQPGGTAFSLCASSIAELYRSGTIPVEAPPGFAPETDYEKVVAEAKAMNYPYVFAADSIEELAMQTGIDAECLQATIEEYNLMCEQQNDSIFFKKENLFPLHGPRYYAAQFFVDSFGCLGGLKINYKMEVENTSWEAIPGLYGVGSEVNTLYAGTYPEHMSGNTSGFAYTSGIMAAENAAAYLSSIGGGAHHD